MQVSSSFRNAFDKASGQVNIKNFGKLGASVRQAQENLSGIRHIPSWNAHLSFRTYKQCCNTGVPTQGQY